MAETGVAVVSPSSVYTILKAAGLIGRWHPEREAHRKGFVQPVRPHEHWHMDIAYLNILGTQYFCSLSSTAIRARSCTTRSAGP